MLRTGRVLANHPWCTHISCTGDSAETAGSVPGMRGPLRSARGVELVNARRGYTQSRQLRVRSVPYGSKTIRGEIMQTINTLTPQWVMLKTSAQTAVSLCYGQRMQLSLFSPLRGSGAWDPWGCSNKHPKATALVLVCGNTWKLAWINAR